MHLEEREFLFHVGKASYVDADGNEIRLKNGDTVYVSPDERQQIKKIGYAVMKVICMIPILRGVIVKKLSPAPKATRKRKKKNYKKAHLTHNF